MIDFCLVVSAHGGLRVEQCRQQILLDVVHLCRVLLHAMQDVFYMGVGQLQELVAHDLCRIPAAGDHDLTMRRDPLFSFMILEDKGA